MSLSRNADHASDHLALVHQLERFIDALERKGAFHPLVKLDVVEFIAVLKDKRVRVVVLHLEGATPQFWSSMPWWGKNPVTGKRILHSGDPEND